MNILTDQELLELHELLDSLVENNLPKARLVRLEKWIADNDFVREVHQAVNDYNEWEPKNKQEEKVKSFIDNLAHKYQQQDDDRQFARGTSLDYANPPLNPK